MSDKNDEDLYIRTDNRVIRYRKRGKGDNPLIFIHGLGAFIEVWNPLMDSLDEKKFSMFAIDLPGHGKTKFPKSEMKEFYSENGPFIKAIDLLIEQENISNPILVGNSMGGGISMLYSIFRSKKISGCVLIDPFGGNNSIGVMYRLMSARPVNWYYKRQKPTRETISLGWKNSFSASEPPEWLIQESQKYYNDRENWESYFNLVKYAVSIFGLRKKNLNKIREEFSKSQIPKIVIWGEKDKVLSISEGQKYFSDVKNASFMVIKNAGHVPMIEFPQIVADYIDQFVESMIV